LLEIALSTKYAGIVRATALDLLRRYATSELADRVAGLLRDRDPLVRSAAIPLQRAAPPTTRVRRIGSLLEDERRAVRIEAARGLLDLLGRSPPVPLPRSVRTAMGEYQRSLAAKADFPAAQVAIAGTALVLRDLPVAERAFAEAVRMDPQRVDAWAMIARLRAARGNRTGAVEALREGLAANRGNETLTKLLNQMLGSSRPN
jgi:tetratricopeptide (TPR) repeat protein